MPLFIPFSEADLPIAIVHEYRISTKSRIIYITIILSVIAGLLFLQFMSMPFSVITKGVIYSIDSMPVDIPNGMSNVSRKKQYDSSNNLILAYCDVNPSDIVMINIGQEVRIQVDGFDEETWGVVRGKVFKISDGLVLTTSSPAFRVYFALDRDNLQRNGRKAFLKAGLKVSVKFKSNSRRLLKSYAGNYSPKFQILWI